MKRIISVLLFLCLLPLGAGAEENGDDWQDWREYWQEGGLLDFCDVQDDTLILFEGVTVLGYPDTYVWDEETGKYIETEPRFEAGNNFERWVDGDVFHRVSLPSTLKYLGMESFISYHFPEFTLPKQLEGIELEAFLYCTFDVLRIETTLPAEEMLAGISNARVAAYEVPEDHPLYSSVDGVLFSKDGKTLISYPNGKEDQHYDVPKGVEQITGGAFCNEYLQTLSLPIGLQSIEAYAFASCTRLQSLAVPLTVKSIGEDILYNCVSMELLSLPDGLEVERDESLAEYYPDDAIFRGDNGDTLFGSRSEGDIFAAGKLNFTKRSDAKNALPEGVVQVYDTAEATGSIRGYRSGKIVYLGSYQNGHAAIYDPLGGTPSNIMIEKNLLGWVNIQDIQYLPGETLFEYADILPQEQMDIWWTNLPEKKKQVPWKTIVPLEDTRYNVTLLGPFLRFSEIYSGVTFACKVQDAILTRITDENENEYGIVFNTDIFSDIPFCAKAGGERMKELSGGTQVQLLSKEDGWVRVWDGQDEGWVAEENVMAVPEEEE